METGSNEERLFKKYIELHGDDKELAETDNMVYDMGQRLNFARKIIKDGNKTVVDLGSHFGGMSYVLNELGIRAISTDIAKRKCRRIRDRGINEEAVQCDSFRLPFRKLDALVSYMFLGMYIRPMLREGHSLEGIFDELLSSAGAVYIVELKSEYTEWSNRNDACFNRLFYSDYTSKLIEQKLKKALPKINVEYIGEFGEYSEKGISSERVGFKLTKKRGQRHLPKPFAYVRQLIFRSLD